MPVNFTIPAHTDLYIRKPNGPWTEHRTEKKLEFEMWSEERPGGWLIFEHAGYEIEIEKERTIQP